MKESKILRMFALAVCVLVWTNVQTNKQSMRVFVEMRQSHWIALCERPCMRDFNARSPHFFFSLSSYVLFLMEFKKTTKHTPNQTSEPNERTTATTKKIGLFFAHIRFIRAWFHRGAHNFRNFLLLATMTMMVCERRYMPRPFLRHFVLASLPSET